MAGGRTWRLAVLGNEDINLVVGQDLAEFDSELRWARHVTLAVAPPVLLLLAAGGWLLAVRALRPVRVLAHMTGGITARRLGRRVPASEADREFRDLIDTVNGMLDRLEKSFHQAARFSADAAHELKTPLTLLQGQLELAMRTAPADSPEQRTYAGLLEEVHRLKTIVTKLLLLAKADSEQLKLGLERLDLSREVEALCGDARGTAPGLTLRTDIAPGVAAMADRDLLQHAMGNLVSNAVAYNRENGVIEFRLRREGEKAVLTISNTTAPGTRLNPDRVFERFYRGDTAHSRQVDGVGLGLSLAREIARAHGGDLRLSDCREDWVSFDLSLPVAS
jgi:signal transduction histidine kinase